MVGMSKKAAKQALDEFNLLVVRELRRKDRVAQPVWGSSANASWRHASAATPPQANRLRFSRVGGGRFTPAKALKDSVLGVTAAVAKAKPAAKAKPVAAKTVGKK